MEPVWRSKHLSRGPFVLITDCIMVLITVLITVLIMVLITVLVTALIPVSQVEHGVGWHVADLRHSLAACDPAGVVRAVK